MLHSMLTVMEFSLLLTVLGLGLGMAYHCESFLLEFMDLFLPELAASLFR